MLRVGLTGGLASGKSFVGDVLERKGCRILKADEQGHAVLEPGGEAHSGVVAAFGAEILSGDGTIDRKRLAAIVFADNEQLRRLNALVHPAVVQREEDWLQQVEADDPGAIAVVEAAILIETGSYRRFDKLILAVCGEEQQVERAMSRDGVTREEVLARLRRQMSLEEKKRFADYLIDTSGSESDTTLQVERVYEELRKLNL